MQTEHFKEALETEKKTLEHELAGVGTKNRKVPGDYEPVGSEQGMESDPGDQAKITQSFEENEGVERDLEARFDAVLAALARIDNGTYGECTVCGMAISKERLAADPAASTCVRHL
jgi:RNA polymerase-binding transcription factor DksA